MQRRMLLLAAIPSALAAPAVAGTTTAFPQPPHHHHRRRPAAGGPTDTITRIVADSMGRHLDQPVVVESVIGAFPSVGAAAPGPVEARMAIR